MDATGTHCKSSLRHLFVSICKSKIVLWNTLEQEEAFKNQRLVPGFLESSSYTVNQGAATYIIYTYMHICQLRCTRYKKLQIFFSAASSLRCVTGAKHGLHKPQGKELLLKFYYLIKADMARSLSPTLSLALLTTSAI